MTIMSGIMTTIWRTLWACAQSQHLGCEGKFAFVYIKQYGTRNSSTPKGIGKLPEFQTRPSYKDMHRSKGHNMFLNIPALSHAERCSQSGNLQPKND